MLRSATLALCLLFTACAAGDRAASGSWAGAIDTLANGALHIRNPAAGLWDEATAWRIEEELRIGTAAGSGPGEFKGPIALRWDHAGRLWVVDHGNARYAIFDTTGTYQTMVRRTSGYIRIPWPGGFDDAGRFYDVANIAPANATSWTEGFIAFRVDAPDPSPADTFQIPQFEGEVFEALNQRGQRSMTMVVPFAPRLVWYFEPRSALWAAITGDYRIARIDAAGDTTRIVERAFRPIPVTSADRAEALENLERFTQMGGKIDPARIPSTKPAIHSLFTDSDGYLWVQPVTTAEDQGHLVDIFDPDGRYLGELRLPFKLGYFPSLIIGDRLYAITQDELEVQYIVRARIVGKGVGRTSQLVVGYVCGYDWLRMHCPV